MIKGRPRSQSPAAVAAAAATSAPFAPSVRRAALIAAVSLPWALFAFFALSSLSAGTGSSPAAAPAARRMRRSLAVYQSCSVSSLVKPSRPIVPVYGAAYPGSGSQMLHYLSEALTGLEAGEDWTDRGDSYDKVLIKTHYPARRKNVEGNRLMDRAVLLVRNPLRALPSHANFHYEKDRGLPDHTEKATVEYWTEWRDANFDDEIRLWERHVSHWASHRPKEKRLVVSYEHAVDKKRGPVEAVRIAAFLGRQHGVDAVPTERVPCVWDKVVNYKRPKRRRAREAAVSSSSSSSAAGAAAAEGKASKASANYVSHEHPDDPNNHSLRGGPDVEYRFTAPQLKTVLRILEGLKSKFMEDYTLVMSLEEYIEDCRAKLREAQEESGEEGRGTVKKGGSN